MTQFVEKQPALRGVWQKAQAILVTAAWPAAALLLAKVRLLGAAWPAAGVVVLLTPMPLLAFVAAGGVLGSLLLLPATEAAKQLAVIGAGCLARLILRDKSGRLPVFIGAAALLLAEVALQVRLGGQFSDSFLAVAQAGFVLAATQAGTRLHRAFMRGGAGYAAKSETACAVFAAVMMLAALAAFAPLGISLAAVSAGVLTLVLARRQEWEKALAAGLAAAAVLPAADTRLAAFGLAAAAGALVIYSLRPAKRTGLACCYAVAGLWGGVPAVGTRQALLCAAAAALAAAVFLLLPSAWCDYAGADAASVCASRLTGLARALADISDTVTEVCTALPAANQLTSLENTLCAGVCKNCKNNCVCWVEHAGDMTDSVMQLEQLGSLPAQGLPGAVGRLCERPVKVAQAAGDYFAKRLALRQKPIRCGRL